MLHVWYHDTVTMTRWHRGVHMITSSCSTRWPQSYNLDKLNDKTSCESVSHKIADPHWKIHTPTPPSSSHTPTNHYQPTSQITPTQRRRRCHRRLGGCSRCRCVDLHHRQEGRASWHGGGWGGGWGGGRARRRLLARCRDLLRNHGQGLLAPDHCQPAPAQAGACRWRLS